MRRLISIRRSIIINNGVVLCGSLVLSALLLLPFLTDAQNISSDGGGGAAAGPSRSWLYLLQLESPSTISAIPSGQFRYLTTDYSYDGTADMQLTKADLAALHGKVQVALAYLSIGEAEDYRYYWQSKWSTSPPTWLGRPNPDWEGNFKVKYWDSQWQSIVMKYLDRIVNAGFDGVYLDTIDSFDYWSNATLLQNAKENATALTRSTAAQYVMTFVKTLAARARKVNPGFLVFPQNGESLLSYDKDGSYLKAVDGIGNEDVWYDGLEVKSAKAVNQTLDYLRQFAAAGKTVLAVDYVDDGTGCSGANEKRIRDFLSASYAENFIPYVATQSRELSEITSTCLN